MDTWKTSFCGLLLVFNGKRSLADMAIEPINVDAQESFRFIFSKNDVPQFRSYRIRVLETC